MSSSSRLEIVSGLDLQIRNYDQVAALKSSMPFVARAALAAGLLLLSPSGPSWAYVDLPKMNLPELGQQKEPPEPSPARRALEKILKLKENQQAFSQRQDSEYLEYMGRKLEALEKGDKSGLLSPKECWALIPSAQLKSWQKGPLPPESLPYISATQDKKAAKEDYEEKAALGEGVALVSLKACQGFKAGGERPEAEFDLFFAKKLKVLATTD